MSNKFNLGSFHSAATFLSLSPILFLFIIFPWIVKEFRFTNGLSAYSWYSNTDLWSDFFLYYKSVSLFVLSGICLYFLLFIFCKKLDRNFLRLFFPLFFFSAFAVLSAVFSPYRHTAFTGIYEQQESVFILLSYVILCLYTFTVSDSKKAISILISVLTIGLSLLTILGLLQLSSNDPYQSNWGKYLISTDRPKDELGLVAFIFEANRVYLNLYNPNTAAMFLVLFLPLIFILAFISPKKYMKIFYIGLLLLLSLCLLGTRSTTSYIALTGGFFLLLTVFLLYKKKSKKWMIIIFISFPILFFTIPFLYCLLFPPQPSENIISEIQTNDQDIQVTRNGETLSIQFHGENPSHIFYIFRDSNGNEIPYLYNKKDRSVSLKDERFKDYTFLVVEFQDFLGFSLRYNHLDWYFSNQLGDYSYYYWNQYQKFDKITTPKTSFLNGYESIASNRGYIWNRALPLLKKHLILGSGADTFLFEFPQTDYVGKRNFGFENGVMTKPHNLYLQIAIQNGVPALLAFLTFYGLYLFQCIFCYYKSNQATKLLYLSMGIQAGSFAFFICGLTNDSSVCVTPFFFIMTGLGIRINLMLCQQDLF